MLGLRWQDLDLSEGTIRVRMCLKVLLCPDGKRMVTLAGLKNG